MSVFFQFDCCVGVSVRITSVESQKASGLVHIPSSKHVLSSVQTGEWGGRERRDTMWGRVRQVFCNNNRNSDMTPHPTPQPGQQLQQPPFWTKSSNLHQIWHLFPMFLPVLLSLAVCSVSFHSYLPHPPLLHTVIRFTFPHRPLVSVKHRDNIRACSEMREEALELRSQLTATLPPQTERARLNDCLIFIRRGGEQDRGRKLERAWSLCVGVLKNHLCNWICLTTQRLWGVERAFMSDRRKQNLCSTTTKITLLSMLWHYFTAVLLHTVDLSYGPTPSASDKSS